MTRRALKLETRYARDFAAARVGYVTPRTDAEIIAGWRDAMYYRADTETGYGKVCELIPECMCDGRSPWKPGIHMPRWASRIDLDVVGIRIELLNDISEADAKAEGVEPFFTRFPEIGRDQRICSGEYARDAEHRASFAVLWDEINGDRVLWNANPWVWVVEFRRVEAAERAA